MKRVNFKSTFALVSALFAFVAVGSRAYCKNVEPNIIPAVQQWIGGEGVCVLSKTIVVTDSELEPLAEMLKADLSAVSEKSFSVDDEDCVADADAGDIVLTIDSSVEGKEGYEIEIGDVVVLKAANTDGLFYATRSLLQMAIQGNSALPKGKIVDKPDYRVRSVMLDVGRKFMPYEQLKDWVVAMSYVKMNQLHLHLNDSIAFAPGFRLEMKTLPGLANKDGHYTQDQMKELQQIAKERGITIIPEIDAPAHASAFTTYRPDLIHPKLGSQNLDLTNPGTLPFMEKVIDEVCEVFESKHIHIGTDELRLGGIRDKKEKEEMGELFRGYINHFNKYLKAKGRTTRIWSGYEHMPGKTQPDKDVVIDMWVTNDAAAKVKEGYSFINSNHSYTYIVPCTPIYGINNRNIYENWAPNFFSNKKGGIIPKDTPNLLGGKFHIWNDNGYQHGGYSNNEIARAAMSSLLVFSEKLWGRKGSANFNEFNTRAAKVLPGTDGFQLTSHSKSKHDAKNTVLGAFPGTNFLDRGVKSDKNGLVWKLDKPTNFVENASVKIDLDGTPDNLSYPWTANFEVTRYSDNKIGWMKSPHAHEMLLNSRLCSLYLDYTYFDNFDKKTGLPKEKKQGVCLIRAARSAAPTPEQHLNRQIAYFDYQVPVGKKVKLTFLGYRGYTELYVDGKLHKRVNQQCVCPLVSVGDADWGSSFHGRLDKAEIFDRIVLPKVSDK